MSKGHTIEKTKLTIAREARPQKMGLKQAQMTLGWPAQADRPSLFLRRLGTPFGLGFLRVINSLRAKIRRHPSIGTRRNLGESDDGRQRPPRVLEVV
jgi:hypothetical protein